jgi:putative FmdB family regulatory protein
MPMYDYRCRECGEEMTIICAMTDERAPKYACPCGDELKPVFYFANKSMFKEHYSPGIGEYVTNEKGYAEAAKRLSEKASIAWATTRITPRYRCRRLERRAPPRQRRRRFMTCSQWPASGHNPPVPA